MAADILAHGFLLFFVGSWGLQVEASGAVYVITFRWEYRITLYLGFFSGKE